MRYVGFRVTGDEWSSKQEVMEDRQISTLVEIIEVMENATYDTWLEGLGSPRSIAEIDLWKTMAKFLKRLKV